MNEAGAVRSVTERAHATLDLRFVEVDGSWQEAGPLRFRAVEVVHVPYLRCFGYLFDRGGRIVAYSGDTTPCDGLSELAREADVLVVECNGRHAPPGVPADPHGRGLHPRAAGRAPGRPAVLTHLGEQVDLASLPGVTVPDDFERLDRLTLSDAGRRSAKR